MPRCFLLLFLLAALCGPAEARRPDPVTGVFDYYALALSWSPSYCSENHDVDQCATGRQLGFVLHGLWPQFESGFPASCSNEPLSNEVRRDYSPLFPSPKMIGHQWRKHGTCSGLAPAPYFALASKLRTQLRIPAAFERPPQPVRLTPRAFAQAFKAANPGLAPDSVLPYCAAGGRFLREAHACFTRDGRSRTCSASQIRRSENSCRQADFLLQSVR